MDKKLFQYPEDDFFILLYNESLLEFNIQKANAFLIESCNCFVLFSLWWAMPESSPHAQSRRRRGPGRENLACKQQALND